MVLLWYWDVPGVSAQTVQVETRFERDVSRYRWVASTSVREQMGKWRFELLDGFSSDGYILTADRLTFRDENELYWNVDRPVHSRVTGRLWGRSVWFSHSRVFSQDVYTGFRYAPRDFFWIEPAVGVSLDQRPGVSLQAATPPLRTDAGPAFGASLGYSPPSLAGYTFRAEADGSWQFITPRRGRSIHLTTAVERAFQDTKLDAFFQFSSFRRDAYQAVSFLNRGVPTDRLSETVEATISDTLLTTLRLDAPFYRSLRLTARFDLAMNDRYVRMHRTPAEALFFDTNFDRSALDIEAALLYDTPRLMARLAVQRGAEVERRQLANRDELPPAQAGPRSNILEQADFDQGHLSLNGRLRSSLGGLMVFTFDGTASILRHDTPESNLDDRDEVYHHGEAGLLFRMSRYFQMDVRMLGTYYHTIYLDATRSAENNVQQSLRLRPSFQWSPSPLTRIRFGTEVRATYTVDDFVLPGRRPNDQSARELRYDLDFESDLGSGIRFRMEGSVSNLFLGRLIWDRFAEIPFDTLRTYSGWIRLQAGTKIITDVGLRFFIRSDFDRATTVRYPRVGENGEILRDENGDILTGTITRPGRVSIEQVGPTCAVTWPMRGRSALRLNGWLNVQHIRQRLYGDLPTTTAARIQEAGRRGTRKIIPNVSLSLLWNL